MWGCFLKDGGGKWDVKDPLVAKGRQDPGLETSTVETSGCVSLRSSRLQAISLGALQKRGICSLVSKNAFPQVDGFKRDVLQTWLGFQYSGIDLRRIRERGWIRDRVPSKRGWT